MGERTAISWTDHTFNPWIGCTKISRGCALCYAERENEFRKWNPAGWGPGAPRKRTSEANWKKPIEWARQAKAAGIVRRVFCASLADIFDPEAPAEWRNDLWQLIADCKNLEWLLLTKRPENIAEMMPQGWLMFPPEWIRIGVTAEDQENANKRVYKLLHAWGGKNFISYEPALGLLDLSNIKPEGYQRRQYDALRGFTVYENSSGGAAFQDMPKAHWVICGGESGAGCRPMDLQWARDLRDECQAQRIPFFFKQIGGYPNKRHDPADWPEDLRVQEFPED